MHGELEVDLFFIKTKVKTQKQYIFWGQQFNIKAVKIVWSDGLISG